MQSCCFQANYFFTPFKSLRSNSTSNSPIFTSLSSPKEEGDAYHELTEDQLRALVLYCEHDVVAAESTSADRQPTAFSMLKALLNRKFQSKEIADLMEKVFQLSIKSPMEAVRSSCRQLALQYLLNYPLGKKIKGKTCWLACT